MKIVDRGGGTPIVVIPGIQGRWEWMTPAVDALAQRCRVITFSLADEPSSGAPFDPSRGFGCYVEQVRAALDAAGVPRAAICGMSYGGPIAAAFAARYPGRTSSLILVSPLPVSWTPDRRVAFYLRAPRLLAPIFLLAALRLYAEIAAATPGFWRGIRAALRLAWLALTHMSSPGRMARRARLLAAVDLSAEVARVRMPTLLITGEPALDRIVPVDASLDYRRIWPHLRVEMLARTGHLGLLTRADDFARMAVPFAERAASRSDTDRGRLVG